MFDHFLDFALWFPLAVGAAVGLIATRTARDAAARVGLMDRPDGRRKMQSRPVPVSGGVAVLVATLLTVAVSVLASSSLVPVFAAELRRVVALAVAGVAITAIGLLDDRFNLRARYKLLGQGAAALVVVNGGFLIEQVSLFGWVVEFGPLATPLTVFWLLACMNSLNLIDGMDGLLGTVGFVGLLSLAAMSLLTGQIFVAVVAFAMAGAVAGFLCYNLPPATVYMGDAGSMLIGLVIGALAIPSSLKAPATVALLCPVAVLVLPMLDTTAAITRRKLTGRGLAIGDRGHLHHVLLRSGLTVRRILVLVLVLCLVASAGALVSLAMSNDIYALATALSVVVTLLITRLFGHAEFDLVRQRVGHSLRGALRSRSDETSSTLCVRLQGHADWDSAWRELAAAAEAVNLSAISLDINSPFFHENYLARWSRHGVQQPHGPGWRMEVPLFGHDHYLGRLVLASDAGRLSAEEQMLVVSKVVGRAEALVGERVGVLRQPGSARETVVLDRLTPLEVPALVPSPQ